MFEEISKEIKQITDKNISPTNCENRWRVLERAYKKYVSDNNRTGAARKEFEYADIMHNILGKKKNIHPEVLLSSETAGNIDTVITTSETPADSNIIFNDVTPVTATTSQTTIKKKQPAEKKLYPNKKLKCQLLKQIRRHRQDYYNKRLEQENKKLEEKIKKNKLFEERNEILKDLINMDQVHPSVKDLLNS
ncbi:hypothetical protein NQ315_009055 [Exocentrus adspersus]|uniref:Myb/SANT-like DNA-binding domain-containing protein n=1 Tax=Exocentrus adspersus TaxID=1586481 RepID=A0AAV8VDU5_9CUCU|nr:hypothetical protein NQ315_009055 [Exocentrus adspersus]